MGFFSKLWKGVKKTFKKIGRGIKKVFKKVGKWAGKLGVVGQIALSFIPFGQLFAPLLQGFSSSFLGILGKGLASANPLIKGASWIVNAAYKTGSAIYKGYKTVTGAVSKFIGETVGFIGSKIPGVNKVIGKGQFFGKGPAAENFFGTGSDSVLGRVGEQVSADWGSFKKAVGGIVEFNPTAKGVEYMKDANIMKGEYRYKSPDIDPKTMKIDLKTKEPIPGTGTLFDRAENGDIIPGTSISVQDQIQRLGGQLPEYLKDRPITGAISGPSIYTGDRTDYLNALTEKNFKLTASSNGADAIATSQDVEIKTDAPVDTQSLLGRVGDSMVDSAVNLPANLATSLATGAAQQEILGDTMPEVGPSKALDIDNSYLGYNIGDLIAGLQPLNLSTPMYYQNNEYNALMANLMNSTGVSGGAFGNPFMNLSQQQAA